MFTRTDTVTVPVTVTVKVLQLCQWLTVRLNGKTDVEPILPVRWAVIISTMMNFGGDGDGHSDGVCTCKHTLKYCDGWCAHNSHFIILYCIDEEC